jgi:hypothetical protein
MSQITENAMVVREFGTAWSESFAPSGDSVFSTMVILQQDDENADKLAWRAMRRVKHLGQTRLTRVTLACNGSNDKRTWKGRYRIATKLAVALARSSGHLVIQLDDKVGIAAARRWAARLMGASGSAVHLSVTLGGRLLDLTPALLAVT